MASSTKNEEAIARAKTLNNTPWCDDYEKMISGMKFVQFPCVAGYVLTVATADTIRLFPSY